MENQAVLKNAQNVVRALLHKDRQRLINLIKENTGINVTEIYVKMRIKQSLASQYLSMLRSVGLVYAQRDGKQKKYFLNQARYDYIIEALKSI